MSREQKPISELNIELYKEFQASIESLGRLVDLQGKRIDQLWNYVEMFVTSTAVFDKNETQHDRRLEFLLKRIAELERGSDE